MAGWLVTSSTRRTEDEARLQPRARARLHTATPHEAQPLDLVPTVPGLSQRLSRVQRDAISQLDRGPRVPEARLRPSSKVRTPPPANAGGLPASKAGTRTAPGPWPQRLRDADGTTLQASSCWPAGSKTIPQASPDPARAAPRPRGL